MTSETRCRGGLHRHLAGVVRRLGRQWLGVTALMVALSGGVVLGHGDVVPMASSGITFHGANLPTLPGAGCPANTASVYNLQPGTYNSAAYARDASGVVHLRGAVAVCNVSSGQYLVLFTLPAGFRPARHEAFANVEDDQQGTIGPASLRVFPNGQVAAYNFWIDSSVTAWLDGLTFRCAPSGSNGCP
jgi:hypothetical protein